MIGDVRWKVKFLKSKYSLYFTIKKYEKYFSDLGFNRYFLDYEKVLMMIERAGVRTVEDRTFVEPFLWFGNGEKVLFYNPEIHPEKLTLLLGHELGHLICGHYTENMMYFKNVNNVFARKMERDADIVGYLCWIPTFYLNRIKEYRWDLEDMISDLTSCDTEHGFLSRNLPARLRIYRAYLRADEEISRVQSMIEELSYHAF